MKHHPELFNARNLQNDTRLLFKLKLLLGTVCAYEGEVPLSVKELASRMKTSPYRIRLLLKKLEVEGLIRYDQNGKLFFNLYCFVQEKEEGQSTQDDLYSKNFVFFTCDEFLSEERNVQRFVLHCVGHKLIYLPGTYYWEHVDALYGETGLLNLRTRKEALEVLKKAEKYLYIRMPKNGKAFQITGLRKEWEEMGDIHSEGSLLWVQKQLKKHRFCMDFISKEALIQITKVMEYYYAEFGYTLATEVFDTALHGIQKHPERSYNFLKMIYEEKNSYSQEELNEISAYFSKVMKNAQMSYTEQLSMEIEIHEETKKSAELTLFDEKGFMEEKEVLLEENTKAINRKQSKLNLMAKSWTKQFDQDPEWFVKQYSRIQFLPAVPFHALKKKIEYYMEDAGQKQQVNYYDEALPF